MQKIINKQKAPKDIILNSILKEIGEENGIVVEPKVVETKKTKKKKKYNWKKLFFNILIGMVFILFSFLIYLMLAKEKTESHLHPKVVKPIKIPKVTPKPIIKKDTLKKVSKTVKKTTIKKRKIIQEEPKVLEHEKAKATLLQQMKN